MDFNSLEELKNRLMPALSTRVSELKAKGVLDISEEDIWNILSITKWKDAKGLSLFDMVKDILEEEIG